MRRIVLRAMTLTGTAGLLLSAVPVALSCACLAAAWLYTEPRP